MKKTTLLKDLTLFGVMLFVLAVSTELMAYPTGRTGATLKSGTAGCSCHNPSTVISGVLTGPSSVTAGQTYTYTLTINMPSGSGGEGCDIATKNGTLAVIAGSGLKLSNGELTHSSALSYSNPKIIQFSYTAPNINGTDTLYATVDRGFSGAWRFASNFGITVNAASSIISNEVPVSFALNQNYPNPFNPSTQIQYSIIEKGLVTLKVYDISGKEIAKLVNENQNAGTYSVAFAGANYPSGVYYYKLTSGSNTEVKKMMLIK